MLRVPVPDVWALEQELRQEPAQGLKSFGRCVLAGEFAWALTAPLVLFVSYVAFLICCRLIQGPASVRRVSDCELGKSNPFAAMMPNGRGSESSGSGRGSESSG